MDKIEKYQNILVEYLTAYASVQPSNQMEVKSYVIADREHNHFQLLRIGWQGALYVFSVVLHFDILDGKVWFQRNATEQDVVDVLMEKGVAREDIVLGFRAPYARPYTGYAVA